MIRELGEWVKGKAGDDLSELAASRVSQAAHKQFAPADLILPMTGSSGVLYERHIGSVC
jgi:hypothetical protein